MACFYWSLGLGLWYGGWRIRQNSTQDCVETKGGEVCGDIVNESDSWTGGGVLIAMFSVLIGSYLLGLAAPKFT